MSEFKKLLNGDPTTPGKIEEPFLSKLNVATWRFRAKLETTQRLQLELQVANREASEADQKLKSLFAELRDLCGIDLQNGTDWDMDTGAVIPPRSTSTNVQ